MFERTTHPVLLFSLDVYCANIFNLAFGILGLSLHLLRRKIMLTDQLAARNDEELQLEYEE